MRHPFSISLLGLCVTILFAVTWAVYTLGPRPLDIFDSAWLTGDLAVVYVAWVQYLSDPNSHWLMSSRMSFPLEMNFALFDPMPLLLLLAQPFTEIIPDGSQWFGAYFVVCLILQGCFGFFITDRLLKIGPQRSIQTQAVIKTLAAMMFVLVPFTFYRFQGHTALSSQWVILLAIWSVLYTRNARETSWLLVNCGVLLIATGLNPYLAFMVAGNAVIFAVFNWFRIGIIKFGIRIVAIAITAIAGLTMFGFMSASDTATVGYGLYSMNLLGPIDSNGYGSLWSLDIPDATGEQTFEGFTYLGFGVLVLLASAISVFRIHLFDKDFPLIPVLTVIIVFFLLALSSSVTFGIHSASIPIPETLAEMFGKFRASGRFFWLSGFWLIVLSLFVLLHIDSHKRLLKILFTVFILQLWDVAGISDKVSATITKFDRAQFNFDESSLKLGQHESVIAFPPWQCDQASTPGGARNYEKIGFLAANNRLATNSFYAARTLPEQLAYHCDYNNIFQSMSPRSLYLLSNTHYRVFMERFPSALNCVTEDSEANVYWCSYTESIIYD